MIRKWGRTPRTLVGPHNAIYVICNASNVNFCLPNFALSHQDSYKSGRTPFRPPFPGTRNSKNIYTCVSLSSNGLSIEVLHTFLAWNSYMYMKISWFQLIMAEFLQLFQFQTRCCKIRTRWATRIIFYSCDTTIRILISWSFEKRGRKGVRSLRFGWLSSIKIDEKHIL